MEKRSRFAGSDVTVLKLANGDSLTVKRRLSAGEQRAMFARMYHTVDGRTRVDSIKVPIATCLAYLLDWNLTDDDGQPVAIKGLPPEDVAAILDALTPEDFKEISEAIDAHSSAMEDARNQEKKTEPGAAGLSSTSPSPVDLVGAMSGSGI